MNSSMHKVIMNVIHHLIQKRIFTMIILLCVVIAIIPKLYVNSVTFSSTHSIFHNTHSTEFLRRTEKVDIEPEDLELGNIGHEDLELGNIEPEVLELGNIEHEDLEPKDLMKVGPFNFLPNFKNPCWLNTNRGINGSLPVRCLPYFYLVGAPKAGTTDVSRRLSKHPQISSKVGKENHWLTRIRYKTNLTSLEDYQETYFKSATQQIVAKSDKNGYHNIVFGDCSASTLWDNHNFNKIPAFKNLTEPPYTNADVLHHLNPRTKIIVMVRNPVDRLYSEFLYITHSTPQDFHKKIVLYLKKAETCFKYRSIRHCLYSSYESRPRLIRFHIGIYYVHLKEYFRVFPRNQVMVIKLEDFSINTEKYMKALFKFLDLKSINSDTLKKIADTNKKANARKEKDKLVGDMFPETRKLLENFYRPFNEKLVQLLGKSFTYN